MSLKKETNEHQGFLYAQILKANYFILYDERT